MDKVNVYHILKGVPSGTVFYSPFLGNVVFDYLTDEDEAEAIVISTEQQFDLRISIHPELRPATEEESEHFKNAYGHWRDGRKKPFKPFDKVLVRNSESFPWKPAIFIREREGDGVFKYNVLVLQSATAADFQHCIPYEGHEHLAFTRNPETDFPF